MGFVLFIISFSGVCVVRSLGCHCSVLWINVLCLFPMAIVKSVLLFTVSDYPFGIFKLFLGVGGPVGHIF